MALLTTLGKGQGYLKAGLLGFPKSGKTFTAALLAIGTREYLKLKGPIAIFDTENGSEYVAPMIAKATGLDLVGIKSRRFDDLLLASKEAEEAGVSVLIVDSITHVWRNLCDSYLKGVNENRSRRNLGRRTSLEFQDWSRIKEAWAPWADYYLNSPLHIIICGRAGFEYDMEKNEETGKRELVKTGVKMKTESEFGFEPSLLIEMEREQIADGRGGWKFARTATVIGDRFNIIDGQSFPNPTFESFKPHIEMLRPLVHSEVKTESTPMEVDDEGDPKWAAERKARTILCEEIQGEIVSVFPGQSAEEKKKKADLLQEVFGTRSWTAVEGMPSEVLRSNLAALKERLSATSVAGAAAAAPKSQQGPTTTDLVKVLGDQVAKAVLWMIANGWLTKDQAQSENPFAALPADKVSKILNAPEAFRRTLNKNGGK